MLLRTTIVDAPPSAMSRQRNSDNQPAYDEIKTVDLRPCGRLRTLGAMNFRILPRVAVLTVLLPAACGRGISPQEFADRFIAAENQAWKTGNIDDLKAIEDPAVVYHLPGLDLSGWKAHEDFILNGRNSVVDLKQTWKFISGENNYIVLTYTSSAVRKADGKNPPQSTSNDYLFVLRLRNQRIAECGQTAVPPTILWQIEIS